MKKEFLFLAMFTAVLTVTLSGCAVHNAMVSGSNAPFYLAYDSEEVIRDQSQVATITSTGGLEIDSVEVNSKNFRSANSGWVKGNIVVADVLPGIHSVKLLRDPSGMAVRVNPVTFNFEAGKTYNIAITFMRMFVEENKSADVVKKIAENRRNNVFESKKK
ncbi:MAG: hypothetical protein LBH32_12180 [Dysgonamonadaceae bacterium]|jgi:hypothetical protein|nr:hypothetical protein [Dysgonamonadaceae bacterium]